MNHYLLSMRVLLGLVAILLVSCDQSRPKVKDHPSSGVSPTPSQQSTSENIPNESTNPLSPLQELIKTAKNAKGAEAYQAIRNVSRHRTDEACTLLIKLLWEESDLIKENRPTQDEWKRVEDEYRRTKKIPADMEPHISSIAKSMRIAKYLVTLDMPEGRKAAYEFRDQIAKKWATSGDFGKKQLESLDIDLRHAEADVKTGAVPWRTQPMQP